MRVLEFNVADQVLKPVGDFSNLVSGTSGYLKAKFNFSEEWIDCTIAVSFYSRGQEYAVILKDGSCEIPEEATARKVFYVRVTGVKKNYKITTNKICVRQKEN